MTSRSRAALVRGLSRRKNREREGLFLAEGVRVAEDLLASAVVPRLALISSSVEDTPRGRALAERLAGACEVERLSDAELGALADTEASQGVVVVAETPRATLEDLRAGAADVVLLLDAVQDPGNAGTLIRSADALGCAGVVALPGTVDPWNPKVVRSAAGSLFRLPIVETDAASLGAWLRSVEGSLLAGDARGTPVEEVAVRGPVVLAVGNEGAGLSPEVAGLATLLVSIPIRGGAESLNVGVAAGILLYEVTRRLARASGHGA